MNKIKLFTHTDLDGVGCAVLAYLAFGADNVDVEYCDYKDIDGKIREFYLFNDKPYDAIYITDISINEENAQEIDSWIARDKIRLLDHHPTAEWLNKYEWAKVRVCDNGIKTSGTAMFCKHLIIKRYFENKYNANIRNNIARFAEVVRDYDTWRWKEELGDKGIVCKQLNDLFHMYGRDQFIEWAVHNIEFHYNFPTFSEADAALLEQKQKDIDIYIDKKNKQLMTMVDNFGYTCGVVFAERYFSELGNKLSELHPELDYIAMVDIGYGGVSYRTVKDDIDLGGEIAHSFGGGGHRKAAGSTFAGEEMRWLVVGNLFELEAESIIV